MPETHPFFRLLERDRRYKLDAYQFVRDALHYAQEELGMGSTQPPDPEKSSEKGRAANHLTGQQLCEAIRLYAIEQYGYMAKAVLNNWGIHSTSDFGEIVYNLIEIELMKKSKTDRREDFNDVYDFDEAFLERFRIRMPD